MIYGLTGHTYGIGKEIANLLIPYVRVYSRTNGWNLTNKQKIYDLIEDLKDVDCFINCAYSGWAQTELLMQFFNQYKHTDKIIINVGSQITNKTVVRDDLIPYCIHKKTLYNTFNLLREIKLELNLPIDLKYVSFGPVKTEHMKKYDNYDTFLEVEHVAEKIVDLVTSKNHESLIT